MTNDLQQARVEAAAKAAYEGAFLRHAPEDVDRWDDLIADNHPAVESWREVAKAALAADDAHLPSAEAIAEILDAHRLVEGSDFAGRLNGEWWCFCRWRESRSGHRAHQAEAVRELFVEVVGDE